MVEEVLGAVDVDHVVDQLRAGGRVRGKPGRRFIPKGAQPDDSHSSTLVAPASISRAQATPGSHLPSGSSSRPSPA